MASFTVSATFAGNVNGSFGPFLDRDRAEQCVLILAARSDVVAAQIVTAIP